MSRPRILGLPALFGRGLRLCWAADRILVMDGGRISEQGTHEELMDAAGTYADLFALQSAAYAVATPA